MRVWRFFLVYLEFHVLTLYPFVGGYDPRVHENISYHHELTGLCESFGFKHITCKNFITSLSIPEDTDVLFLLSIPASWKAYLLKASSLLLYTPEREHFGIVPLEALIAEVFALVLSPRCTVPVLTRTITASGTCAELGWPAGDYHGWRDRLE